MSPSSLPSPELVWGLFERLLALVYCISFGSILTQIVALHGADGIVPFALRRARMKEDFGLRRAVYFPTLLWLGASDRTLRAVPLVGLGSGLYILLGGPHTAVAFLVCYLMYLSLDPVMDLIFPWDSLLFEAGFFAVLLPELSPLPELSAQAAPVPALAWVYQLMVFRLLLGFGRVKFLGSSSEDLGYLKGFLITQPLPSPGGWYFHKAPMWVLKACMLGMFVVEVPLPFLVFAPGIAKAIATVPIMLFLVGIWACGSFGFFSLVLMVLTVTWWDVQTPAQLQLSSLLSPQGPYVVNALAIAHTLAALLSFPSNSLVANAWLNWSIFDRVPRWLAWPLAALRALHPLRWVHAYGVFPPKTYPGVKIVPVLEATWDGAHWRTCEYNFTPVLETSPPRWAAPHHARGDTAVLYEAFSVGDSGVLGAIFGTWSPYGFGKQTGLQLSMQRMLEGKMDRALLRPSSFDLKRDGAPLSVRARLYMLEPTSLEEKRATGLWWHRRCLGPHAPEMRLQDGFWDHALPPPELWHWDHITWQRRSVLGPLLKRAAAGEDPHALLLRSAPGLDQAQLAAFWSEFVPFVQQRDPHSWEGIETHVNAMRGRWSRDTLHAFERIAGRLSALLRARLEPHFLAAGLGPIFGKGRAAIDVPSLYHLTMLTQHVIASGRARYDAVFTQPLSANAEAAAMTMASGHYLQALFRYDILVMDAAKLRLIVNYMEPSGRAPLDERGVALQARLQEALIQGFGSVAASVFLREQFLGPEHIRDIAPHWPRFHLHPTGEVKPVPETRNQPVGQANT
ncbi:MAG: lipase maturation factor family protein [Myxococcales bacterium]|nr:lipase maturation factor family protein [Myxococcales bacterium]